MPSFPFPISCSLWTTDCDILTVGMVDLLWLSRMGYHDYYQSVLLIFSFSFEACVFGWSLSWVNHMLTDLHSTFSGKTQTSVPNLAVNMITLYYCTYCMCNTVINEMCMWYKSYIQYELQIKKRSPSDLHNCEATETVAKKAQKINSEASMDLNPWTPQ